MVKKSKSSQETQPGRDVPVYAIGVAARILKVHPRTLRIYEEEGLIKPARMGNRRMYSANDLTWLGCLRRMIHEDGISIPGIKKLLHFAPCYEIADCPEEVYCTCDSVVDRAIPRHLRLAGTESGKSDRQQEKVKKTRSESPPILNKKLGGGS